MNKGDWPPDKWLLHGWHHQDRVTTQIPRLLGSEHNVEQVGSSGKLDPQHPHCRPPCPWHSDLAALGLSHFEDRLTPMWLSTSDSQSPNLLCGLPGPPGWGDLRPWPAPGFPSPAPWCPQGFPDVVQATLSSVITTKILLPKDTWTWLRPSQVRYVPELSEKKRPTPPGSRASPRAAVKDTDCLSLGRPASPEGPALHQGHPSPGPRLQGDLKHLSLMSGGEVGPPVRNPEPLSRWYLQASSHWLFRPNSRQLWGQRLRRHHHRAMIPCRPHGTTRTLHTLLWKLGVPGEANLPPQRPCQPAANTFWFPSLVVPASAGFARKSTAAPGQAWAHPG